MSAARCAVYFAPHPDSRLWRFGSAILGYDAFRAADVAQPAVGGLSPAGMRAITEEPRRYGFHATLKAPFALAANRSAEDLAAAVRAFAATRTAILLPKLVVAAIGSFIALVPDGPAPALDALAAEIVRAFEPFRAPLAEAERARRRPERLSERQRANLEAWGYPYVFEDFRFHMTLTGPIRDEAMRATLLAALRAAYAGEAAGPVPIDALALFAQPERGARFVILERFAFAL